MLLFLLPAYAYAGAGAGEVKLPVDDKLSQALERARKADPKEARAILEELAKDDSEAVHSDDGVLYYPVRELARRLRAQLGLVEPGEKDPAWPAPERSVPPDLTEDLAREPFWSFKLAERDRRLTAAHGEWIVCMHDREPAVAAEPDRVVQGAYPTVQPVVSEGVVLYRDYVELVTRSLGSGAMLPCTIRYDPPERVEDPDYLYPLGRVRPGTQGHPDPARRWQSIYDYFDYGGNAITAGEGIIVLVEQRRAPEELFSLVPRPPRPNLLAAYGRASGKTRWAWHLDWCARAVRANKDVHAAWQEDFKRHPTPTFFGPGVIAGGLLFTVAREDERVSLWALNTHDGRVRFRTLLHFADPVPGQLPRGTALAVGQGVVFAVTQAGVVAAVDGRGGLRWLRRYPRRVEVDEEKAVRVRQTFAYRDPLVVHDKLIVAAADAKELLALDTGSGRTLWTRPLAELGRVCHLVGAGAGRLVLAGDEVLALDLETGRTAWGPVKLADKPHGRGFVGGRLVHVPTHRWAEAKAFVERFELATGKRAAALEFGVARLGNLRSVGGRLIAANADRVLCFTTCDFELERVDARRKAEGSPPSLWAERARIQLRARPPRREAARRDFRAALAAAERRHEDDRLIRADAMANLFALVREQGDRTALGEARAIVRPMRRRELEEPPRPHPYEAQIALLELSLLPAGEARRGAVEAFLGRYGKTKVVVGDRVVLGEEAVK